MSCAVSRHGLRLRERTSGTSPFLSRKPCAGLLESGLQWLEQMLAQRLRSRGPRRPPGSGILEVGVNGTALVAAVIELVGGDTKRAIEVRPRGCAGTLVKRLDVNLRHRAQLGKVENQLAADPSAHLNDQPSPSTCGTPKMCQHEAGRSGSDSVGTLVRAQAAPDRRWWMDSLWPAFPLRPCCGPPYHPDFPLRRASDLATTIWARGIRRERKRCR